MRIEPHLGGVARPVVDRSGFHRFVSRVLAPRPFVSGSATGIDVGWSWHPELADQGAGVEFVEAVRVADRRSSQGSTATLDVVGGVVDPAVDDALHIGRERYHRRVTRFIGEDG
jgi:hypothetical protein